MLVPASLCVVKVSRNVGQAASIAQRGVKINISFRRRTDFGFNGV
jgi:hypothetical protein